MLSRRPLGWTIAFLSIFVPLSLSGCHASRKAPPSIQFTEVPPASPGGPGRMATLSGRVQGVEPGARVVLYARSQRWWIQPFADQPFTTIGADGTWTAKIHLGMEYGALVVRSEYRPSSATDALPPIGGDVLAVATVKGTQSTREAALLSGEKKVLHFSGYDWEVRQIEGDRNGSPNSYSPDNASVDAKGFLHLRVTGGPGDWLCSEVIQTRSLGYGTYRFTVQDISQMEPALALSLFTWDDSVPDPPHRELTIEFSRWGDPASKNGQFVIQPYYIPANVSRFEAGTGRVRASVHWESGKASFEAGGDSQHTQPSAKHVFSSGVPAPGEERLRMHLCGFKYSKVPLAHEAEVVVEKFEYLP